MGQLGFTELIEFFELYEKYSLTEEELEKFNIPLENDWFKDGPMCLKQMATFGFVEGQRNNTLHEIGVYLKKRFPDDWKKKLEAYNAHWFKNLQGGPLESREVLSTQNSLAKKDYFYGCKKYPLKSFLIISSSSVVNWSPLCPVITTFLGPPSLGCSGML